MLPEFRIGNLCINTYQMMCVIAALWIPTVILLRRKRYGVNVWQSLLLCFSAIVSGFIGCNALYWLENTERLFEEGWSFHGLSFFGSLLFAPLVLILFALLFKIPARSATDLLATGLPPFLGTVRIGCFLGGCCGGIPHIADDGSSYTFPTQLLECGFDFAIFALMLYLEKKHRLDGLRLPLFFVLYGTVRFLIEFLRATEKNIFGFSLGQIYSVLIFLVGGAILLSSFLRSRKNKKAPDRID